MSDHTDDFLDQLEAGEGAPFRQHELSELLLEAHHYKSSAKYYELLQFAAKMRDFAPYNSMLLQIQKPGIRFAATRSNWQQRFGRWPKEGARPLLVLQPFGPVLPVYDLIDTEGADVPESAYWFTAEGNVDESWFADIYDNVRKLPIRWEEFDGGDGRAGWIRGYPEDAKGKRYYAMHINRNHAPVVRMTTVAHELGHLFLGHLGPDKKLKIPRRGYPMSHEELELEAESVAFLACRRHGITPSSAQYLAGYVGKHTNLGSIDMHCVMIAAGKVGKLIGRGP